MRPRALLGLAAAAIAAGGVVLPIQQASACNPYAFPYCTTYCKAVLVYHVNPLLVRAEYLVGEDLPGVPRTGVAGCP